MRRFFILICLLVIVGCTQDKSEEKVEPLVQHEEGPVSTGGGTNLGNTADKKLSGQYEVEGMNPDGSVYEGLLEIQSMGLYYQIDWEVGSSYRGVGLQDGNLLAVGWGEEGCNVILYKVREDGHLVGKWSNSPASKGLGSEEAVPEAGMKGIEGIYTVTGRNPNESLYEGKLEIRQAGELLDVFWQVGNEFSGVGIQSGDLIAIGWGVPESQCGIVLYEVGADGWLLGRWGYMGSGQLGNETVKPIKK